MDPDTAQLRDDLDDARRLERSSYVWSMVAMSPVGIITLYAFLTGGMMGLAWAAVCALGFAVQVRRWKRAEGEVGRLEALLEARTSISTSASEPASPRELKP